MLNVRNMIEGAHGGSADVRSAVGAGTEVILEVPRRQ
jgi:signal transduction histidine kinase